MKSLTIGIFVLGLVATNEGCLLVINPAPSPPAPSPPAPSPPAPSPPAPSPLVRSSNQGELYPIVLYCKTYLVIINLKKNFTSIIKSRIYDMNVMQHDIRKAGIFVYLF